MSSISIAGNSLPLSEASPDWIVQQIDRRRHDGMAVCVVVALQTAGLNMRLATPECGGGVGGRPPNSDEKVILDLWNRHGLNQPGFAAGEVVAFLKQLGHLL